MDVINLLSEVRHELLNRQRLVLRLLPLLEHRGQTLNHLVQPPSHEVGGTVAVRITRQQDTVLRSNVGVVRPARCIYALARSLFPS